MRSTETLGCRAIRQIRSMGSALMHSSEMGSMILRARAEALTLREAAEDGDDAGVESVGDWVGFRSADEFEFDMQAFVAADSQAAPVVLSLATALGLQTLCERCS